MPAHYRTLAFWLPLLAASGLIATGVVAVYWTAISPFADVGGDFGAYRAAAERVWSGEPLYFDRQLAGPYAAAATTAEPNYLYPPPFAALMGWSLLLPLGVGASLWMLLNLTVSGAACYLAARAGGAPANRTTLFALVAAVGWFGPLWLSTVIANVSAWVMLAVALALWGSRRTAAVAGVAGAVLKITPGFLLPALLVARPRQTLLGVAIVALALLPSFVLQFDAWRDFPLALGNLASGDATYDTNFAPAVMAKLHFGAALGSLVGILMLVVSALLLLGSLYWARRPQQLPTAIAAAVTASLLLPNAIWYHYLLVFLPLGIALFVRASWPMRRTLLALHGVLLLAWLFDFGVLLSVAIVVSGITLVRGWRSIGQHTTRAA